MSHDGTATAEFPSTPVTEYPMFANFPVDVWEEGMQAAEKRLTRNYPGAEFRGLIQTAENEIATCAIVPVHETSLVLTSAEWGAIRWLLTEQATMMWTMSRQLKHSSPERAPQAEWWKALEEKVSAAIDEFAPVGPLEPIVAEGMAEREEQQP